MYLNPHIYYINSIYFIYIFRNVYTPDKKSKYAVYIQSSIYIYIYTEYISTCYYNYIITNLMLAPLARVAK